MQFWAMSLHQLIRYVLIYIYICINHLLDISITCVCKEGQGQGHTLSDCKLFIHTLSENGSLNKVQMEKGCIYRSEWLSDEEVCTCSSGC